MKHFCESVKYETISLGFKDNGHVNRGGALIKFIQWHHKRNLQEKITNYRIFQTFISMCVFVCGGGAYLGQQFSEEPERADSYNRAASSERRLRPHTDSTASQRDKRKNQFERSTVKISCECLSAH